MERSPTPSPAGAEDHDEGVWQGARALVDECKVHDTVRGELVVEGGVEKAGTEFSGSSR